LETVALGLLKQAPHLQTERRTIGSFKDGSKTSLGYPNAPRALNKRGLLNREFESFGAFFWGAEGNHDGCPRTPKNSLEPEKNAVFAFMRQPLGTPQVK
jgi:hypothetical protein